MATNQLKNRAVKVDSHLALKAVIVYEDTETGLRAKRALANLPGQQSPGTGFNTRLWRRDLLKPMWLREQAALDAATAHIVIVSVHGREPLPDEIRQWLCAWATRRTTQPCALGILLDAAIAGQARTYPSAGYIQTIAQTAGADLFWGFCESLTPAGSEQPPVFPPGAAIVGLRSNWSFHPAGQHTGWGLNE